eukprot:TRINITY_DN25434_c0_g1_i2.p1 TRINITY_DN25434_c0_g1~~TRINITY_DN25434_c0_g1_i2.p1  ORF type:complete len:330 (+),score=14.00 TRINITY_DN25434_c0_g1_i2:69-992(+)
MSAPWMIGRCSPCRLGLVACALRDSDSAEESHRKRVWIPVMALTTLLLVLLTVIAHGNDSDRYLLSAHAGGASAAEGGDAASGGPAPGRQGLRIRPLLHLLAAERELLPHSEHCGRAELTAAEALQRGALAQAQRSTRAAASRPQRGGQKRGAGAVRRVGLRVALDGEPLTRAQFLRRFGRHREWNRAPPFSPALERLGHVEVRVRPLLHAPPHVPQPSRPVQGGRIAAAGSSRGAAPRRTRCAPSCCSGSTRPRSAVTQPAAVSRRQARPPARGRTRTPMSWSDACCDGAGRLRRDPAAPAAAPGA